MNNSARKLSLTLLAFLCAVLVCSGRGERIHVYVTNDIHGHYFDSLYTSKTRVQSSLMSVARYVRQQRDSVGSDKVILLDVGDFLQGDNASYYYNYVDTDSPHIYPLIAADIGYDAVIVGNHDVEAGPDVLSRVASQLQIPLLAANAVDSLTHKARYGEYTIVKRSGIKVAVIGFTNPNMSSWLDEDQMGGLLFRNPMGGFAQGLVDRVICVEKPDIVMIAIHSGTGDGDDRQLESQGRDLLYSLKGVDAVICAHDHRPYVESFGASVLVNSGSHCNNLGHIVIEVEKKGRRLVSKTVSAEVVPLDRNAVDRALSAKYHQAYTAVKEFSTKKIGTLDVNLATRDAYIGMSDYLNLLHRVSLESSKADISFAAPLKFNGFVKSGDVQFNDLFTIYPFENQLFVVEMTGAQVKAYLEASYDNWINTVSGDDSAPLLKIEKKDDPRTGLKGWSFVARSYNFDSAGGINYTVDVTKAAGERICISSMSEGTEFCPDKLYRVAMTSYRANGGGGLLASSGIPTDGSRVVERHKEIRDMVYDLFLKLGTVTRENLTDSSLSGTWRFVPEEVAEPLLERDLLRLFPKRK